MTADVFDAIDDFYKAAFDGDTEEQIDAENISIYFKKSISDYKRIIKACAREGLVVESDIEDYKNEFVTSVSIANRLEILESIREDIKSMMGICAAPPKDILKKYSEDLVTRIEDGVMDEEFEVFDD